MNRLRTRHKYFIVLGILAVASGFWVACTWLFNDIPRDETISLVESEYSFDPETIQQAIMEEQSGIFRFEWEYDYDSGAEKPTTTAPIAGDSPIQWRETDFWLLVQASTEQLGKEPIDDARLFLIRFTLPCQYASIGPQQIDFGFFHLHPNSVSGGSLYVRRFASVDLMTHHLRWWEQTLTEVSKESVSIDRMGEHIPAEVVLRTAEQNGGTSFRAQQSDQCFISASLASGARDDKWQLEYVASENPDSARFIVQVERDGTGKVVTAAPP